MNKHLKKFQELTPFWNFRPYKNGFEVRVSDLDQSYQKAKELILKHKLKLKVSDKDIQLRSFVVSPK